MKKQNIALLLLFIGVSIIVCSWLFTSRHYEQSLPVVHTKTIAAQLAYTEYLYHQQTRQLEQHRQQLDKALLQSRASLAIATNENHVLQATLQQAIRQQQLYKKQKDTVHLVNHCGTLAANSQAYIAAVNQKDSLQESVQQNLLTQLDNRDSLVSQQQAQNTYLRNQVDLGMRQLKANERSIRRQRTGNRLKSIGLLILSGLAIKQFL